MKHYIYGLYKKNCEYRTNSISENLFYIGIASGEKNLYFREKNHKKEKSNLLKLNIIAKYDFYLKILWKVDTKEECEEREAFLIKWFKRYKDGGILANHLKSSKDFSGINKPITQQTKLKLSKALKKINEKEDFRIKNRDRNLTKPYKEILLLIEKWANNPLETQQKFANRHNISRSKFKDWLRLYKPEYIGLTKKKQKELFFSIYKSDKKPLDIINEFAKLSGYKKEKSKGIYYKFIKQLISNKE